MSFVLAEAEQNKVTDGHAVRAAQTRRQPNTKMILKESAGGEENVLLIRIQGSTNAIT